jgi:CRISPR-associated protein Csd2
VTDIHLDPTRRHDALIFFDATDTNPNGDPDSSNRPRQDPETGHGLVTDAAIKRWIRDTVPALRPDDPRFEIFIETTPMETQFDRMYSRPDGEDPLRWVAQRYYDVRMFGAVFTSKKAQARQANIRGPVQIGVARSLDPVVINEVAMTRKVPHKAEDADRKGTAMYDRDQVVYGLYCARLHFTAARAAQQPVDAEDLDVLWRSIGLMCDLNRSAARSGLDLLGLYVFSHDNQYGNAPAQQVFRSIRHRLIDPDRPPRTFSDYQCERGEPPRGVTLTPIVDAWAEV